MTLRLPVVHARTLHTNTGWLVAPQGAARSVAVLVCTLDGAQLNTIFAHLALLNTHAACTHSGCHRALPSHIKPKVLVTHRHFRPISQMVANCGEGVIGAPPLKNTLLWGSWGLYKGLVMILCCSSNCPLGASRGPF